LAIHASMEKKYIDMRSKYYICDKEPFYSVLQSLSDYSSPNYALYDPLPRGAVLAVCDLKDCFEILTTFSTPEQIRRPEVACVVGFLPISDQERAFGNYTPGRFMWILENIRELKHPIPAKGALGLWEWTPPQDLEFK